MLGLKLNMQVKWAPGLLTLWRPDIGGRSIDDVVWTARSHYQYVHIYFYVCYAHVQRNLIKYFSALVVSFRG